MRKLKPLQNFVSVLSLLLALGSTDVLAAKSAEAQLKKKPGVELVQRRTSRRILIRTRLVIIHTQKAAKEGKEYKGLGNCLRHQRIARRLHIRKRYFLSALHSLRARRLAVLIINNNKGTLIKETNLTREEERLLKNSPGGEALDKELDEKYQNEVPVIDDKAAADEKVEEIKKKKE
ncbi:MAG: hypothetical protein GTO16_14115 [Candidatus Aminicenantes bacterium]|nr:hypothetical protein [Candidatus Aminicenantes bacterium]